jgi:hypothetical protein
MRTVVAIPSAQRSIGGVFKQKLQRRRFNMTIAKYDVGSANMA